MGTRYSTYCVNTGTDPTEYIEEEVFKIKSLKLDFDFIKSSSNAEGIFESVDAMTRIENQIEEEYQRYLESKK